MDFWSLIEEIIDIKLDSLLNIEQKRKFLETTLMDYLYNLKEDEMPAMRAAIKMARDP